MRKSKYYCLPHSPQYLNREMRFKWLPSVSWKSGTYCVWSAPGSVWRMMGGGRGTRATRLQCMARPPPAPTPHTVSVSVSRHRMTLLTSSDQHQVETSTRWSQEAHLPASSDSGYWSQHHNISPVSAQHEDSRQLRPGGDGAQPGAPDHLHQHRQCGDHQALEGVALQLLCHG